MVRVNDSLDGAALPECRSGRTPSAMVPWPPMEAAPEPPASRLPLSGPAAVLAGVDASKEGVGGGQPLVDLGKDLLGKPDRHRDGRTGSGHFTSSYAGRVRKSVKSSLRHKSLINFLAGW